MIATGLPGGLEATARAPAPPPSTPRPRLALAGGAAAIAAPTLMWTFFIGAGLRTPGYDLTTRAASDLAERGAGTAAVFVPAFFLVPGVLIVLVGLGLGAGVPGSWLWRAGAALVAVEGALLALVGLFAEDPGSPAATALHQHLALTEFTVAALVPLVLWAGATMAPAPPAPRGLWLVAGLSLLILLTGGTWLGSIVRVPDGYVQRPQGVVQAALFAGTGIWMLRLAARSLRTPRPARLAAPAD